MGKKLHLGCGNRRLDGWINIDCIKYNTVDIVGDVSSLEMIEDNSVDEIYASHVLEHFKRREICKVITKWYDKLKPNGMVRISVPSFESIVDIYTKTGNVSVIQGLLYGGQDYDKNFHHVCFDFILLSNTLEECGFRHIDRYSPFDFLPDNFDDYSKAYLPHMDFINGISMCINIKGIK
jgi:predicted SAM-dependent methyltransferase